LHPRRLLRVIRRKWKTVLAAMCFAFLVAGVYLWSTQKTYRATSLIEMSQRRPHYMNQQGAVIEDSAYAPAEDVFTTRLKKLNTPSFRTFVVPLFKKANPSLNLRDDQIAGMLSGAAFSLVAKSSLVQISYEGSNPELVASVVNVLAEATELYATEENRRESDSAVAWLQAEAELRSKKREDAEQAIVAFRKENKMDILENKKKYVEDSLTSLRTSLGDMENEKQMSENMVQTLADLEIKCENAGKLPASAPHADEIKTAVDSLNAAIAERNTLLIRYKPKHPEVIEKEKTIALLKDRVLDGLRISKETAASNLDMYKKQEASTKARMAEMIKEGDELEQKILESRGHLTSLETERDARDVSYKGVLNRIEEARLSADENTTTIKIVERASPPSVPSKPNPHRLFFIAFALGLTGGMALALLTDRLEDRITNAADVEFGIGLRVLGLIPHADVSKRDELATASLGDKHGQIVEAFAGVRGIIDSELKKSGASSVLVVSSTSPEEGKTITACNLAIAFAKSGRRTLLVDMDLRKPRIGSIFKMPRDKPGLIDVLWSRDDTNFSLLPFAAANCDNLDIIASRPNNKLRPVDIVSDIFVRDFIIWITQNYDMVIVDTPPFGIVSDAAVLAGLAGGLVMVCRPEVSKKRATRYAVHQFREIDANLIGAIVNDVDLRSNPLLSNYDHHYSYKSYKKYYSPTSVVD
jgi:capsular exopolysaccharide synthesis family protein